MATHMGTFLGANERYERLCICLTHLVLAQVPVVASEDALCRELSGFGEPLLLADVLNLLAEIQKK